MLCVLTGGTVDSVASWLTVLAGGAVETLIATALPVAMVTVLTLSVIGAPAADVSRAFEAFVAVVTRATGLVLQDKDASDSSLRDAEAVFHVVMATQTRTM